MHAISFHCICVPSYVPCSRECNVGVGGLSGRKTGGGGHVCNARSDFAGASSKKKKNECNVRNEATVYRTMGKSLRTKVPQKYFHNFLPNEEGHTRLSDKTDTKASTESRSTVTASIALGLVVKMKHFPVAPPKRR